MLSIEKIIKEEKNLYGKLFTQLNLDQELEIEFLSESECKQRTYIVKRDVLKDYIDLIENIESYNKNHSIMKYVKSISNIHNIRKYKSIYGMTLEQLSECSTCICFQCHKDCPFKACLGCSDNSYISKCDKLTLNVRAHQNYKIKLQNNLTKDKAVYNVLFTLKDCNEGDMFIVLQSPIADEKIILNYYPNGNGDTYGEINDTVIFDKIVSIIKVLI